MTLDTTRADHVGAYGAEGVRTPVLDGIARRGTRWARALTASPLTLPAHCSLLTGLQPPEHGVRDNGLTALPADLPTLATVLSERGYETAAIVASRVLDHRFGLDRGFVTYDDRMLAERLGEYGYAERDARAVTEAALSWFASRAEDSEGRSSPWFLWLHYYDPHAPYAAPSAPSEAPDRERYAAEIGYVDQQLGRLLAALPAGSDPLIAVVGDHGESLGEHGETGHGLFLYSPSLHVPLLLAGPGVAPGRLIPETVASSRLAATLLGLLGFPEAAGPFGTPLPGIGLLSAGDEGLAVYSEALLPATAYGWSASKAISDDRWRLIVAPRSELYDLAADPAERFDLLGAARAQAARLRDTLASMEAAMRRRDAEGVDVADLAATLRDLGYLSGASRATSTGLSFTTGIDAKDGIVMLADLERAKSTLANGRPAEAQAILEPLLERNPENVVFRTQLANARLAAGDGAGAVVELTRAATENPRNVFVHLGLARAQLVLGELEAARLSGSRALELDPRQADAWLLLGEIAARSGEPVEERRLLRQAIEMGTESAVILTRLGQLAIAIGDLEDAEAQLARAAGLAPEWAPTWLLWGDVAERQGRDGPALERYLEAADLDPRDAVAALRASRLLLAAGEPGRARLLLAQAAAAAPESPAGVEARRRLAALDGPP